MIIEDLKETFQYGMHGCGYFKGSEHVNAKEALKYWQRNGIKVMEIDVAKTIDGKFVALAHLMNEKYLRMLEIMPPYEESQYQKYTENWFLNQKICLKTSGGLTPMNLAMIVNEMVDDSEMIVMFDLWRMWSAEETQKFAEALTLIAKTILNRCVIEVYNKDMIDGIRSANPDLRIMYCVHGANEPEYNQEVSPAILKGYGINVVSYPWTYVKRYPGEIETYHKEGFMIFSLYKDNRYSRKMKKAGVNVNLVDVLYLPNNFMGILFERTKNKFFRTLERIAVKRRKI